MGIWEAAESLNTLVDRVMLDWVKAFNPCDLYTKSHSPLNVEELCPYSEDLIAEYFPSKLNR